MDAAQGSLHERAFEERERRGWTQKEVAERAGVGLRTYGTFESGESSPQGATLRKILRALGMDESSASTAEATREAWPRDVRVFLDVLGAWLVTLDEDDRERIIFAETRRIFEQNR